MKLRIISDLECKEAKNNQNSKKKKKSKKYGLCKEPLGQLQTYQHSHWGGGQCKKEKRKSKKLEPYLKKE